MKFTVEVIMGKTCPLDFDFHTMHDYVNSIAALRKQIGVEMGARLPQGDLSDPTEECFGDRFHTSWSLDIDRIHSEPLQSICGLVRDLNIVYQKLSPNLKPEHRRYLPGADIVVRSTDDSVLPIVRNMPFTQVGLEEFRRTFARFLREQSIRLANANAGVISASKPNHRAKAAICG